MDLIIEFFKREHVFFSHFPIALITAGAAVRLWWALRPGGQVAWPSSQLMLALGSAGTFFSILSGLLLTNFQLSLPDPLDDHRKLALILGAWSVANLILSLRPPAWMQTRLPSALWALLGAGLALATGYFGSLVAG